MAEKATRRGRSDSVEAKRKAFEDAQKQIAPPEVLNLTTERELDIWNKMIASRVKTRWTKGQLMLVGQFVKNECMIADMRAAVDQQGLTFTDRRGIIRPHPLLAKLSTLVNVQNSIIRNVGIAASLTTEQKERRQLHNQLDAEAALNDGGANASLLPGGDPNNVSNMADFLARD